MIAEDLRQIYARVPVGSCPAAVVAVLRGLARDQDFEALRALIRILAFELGYDAETRDLIRAVSVADLLSTDTLPDMLRIYALSFRPADFLIHSGVQSLAKTAMRSEDRFRAFQRLVARNSAVRHEVLKCYVLSTFVAMLDMHIEVSAGAKLNILDQIVDECRVVPGNNATSDLEFGEDRILSATATGDALLFVIAHELGHRWFDAMMAGRRSSTGSDPPPAVCREILGVLPGMIESAARLKNKPLSREDGRGFRAASGLTMLCTCTETPSGPYFHLSLMREAGPIERGYAEELAYMILVAMRIAPDASAAAYSPRGIFHFGFREPPRGTSEMIAGVRAQAPSPVANECNAMASQWIAGLLRAGRFGNNEIDVPAGLGLIDRPVRVYGLDPRRIAWDRDVCNQVRSGARLDGAPKEAIEAAFEAAIRCVDLVALRILLTHGLRPVPHFEQLGYSICVVASSGNQAYLCPAPDDVRDLIAALQATGVDLDAPFGGEGTTLLAEASGSSADLVRFLLARGASVNSRGLGGLTPLGIAARFGTMEAIAELVRAGADVNASDGSGNTPLCRAVERGDEPIIRFLLENGANMHIRNRRGEPLVMYAKSVAVLDLLQAAGADFSAADLHGDTALMKVARTGELDMLRALLDCGADVDAVTDLGKTAIHFATESYSSSTRMACLQALLDAGADPNEETNEGDTPLMLAAESGDEQIVRVLIGSGARVNASDRAGNTALLRALMSAGPATKAITELLRAGADVEHRNVSGTSAVELVAERGKDDPVAKLFRNRGSAAGLP